MIDTGFPRHRFVRLWVAALAVAALLAALLAGFYDAALIGALRHGVDASSKYGGLYEFLYVFRVFGKGEAMALLALFLGAMGWRRTGWRLAAALLLVAVAVWTVKPIVGRTRPNGRDNFSFPSGDSATAAAMVAPLGMAAPVLLPVGAAVALTASLSRSYDNAHFPSDVLAGFAIGLLAGLAATYWKPPRWPVLENLRSAHYVPLFLLVYAAMLTPALIKGRGIMIFASQIYLPVCLVALSWRYAAWLVPAGLAGVLKPSLDRLLALPAKIRIAAGAALVVGAGVFLLAWFAPAPSLRPAIAGIGGGLAFLGWMFLFPGSRGSLALNLRRATAGIAAILLAALVTLPVSYHKWRATVRHLASAQPSPVAAEPAAE